MEVTFVVSRDRHILEARAVKPEPEVPLSILAVKAIQSLDRDPILEFPKTFQGETISATVNVTCKER